MTLLKGKVAVITGGANGIGSAITRRFHHEGAKVAVLDIEGRAADETMLSSMVHLKCDVSQPIEVETSIQKTLDYFGQIDILVNNAGRTGGCGNFIDVTLRDWHSYIGVNLTGVFLVGQVVARSMVERKIAGSIINIGSVNSFIAEQGASPYVASKGGVLMLTKAMAYDLAQYGIRVNMIAPGPIRVPGNAQIFDSEPLRTIFTHSVPLGGKPGEGADIAGAAVFLASNDSKFMTGASLVVDGGASAIFRND